MEVPAAATEEEQEGMMMGMVGQWMDPVAAVAGMSPHIHPFKPNEGKKCFPQFYTSSGNECSTGRFG